MDLPSSGFTTFKLTGMVYYNPSSLMILASGRKYIHFLPIFTTFLSPFTLHVEEAIHKKNRILFISLQMLVELFFSKRIICISYNLNKLYKINTFKNFLKWFVYMCQSTHCKGLVSHEWGHSIITLS